MKIAIHTTQDGFDSEWINYCKRNGVLYKTVNCYSSSIMQDVSDCDVVMWHHTHMKYQDVKFAKQLMFAFEHAGKRVFPNFRTAWHFDDKVAQKYLLEALNLPMVKSYVFYDRITAHEWVSSQTFPLVFKLRTGAGSSNVRLVRSADQANKLIGQAFSGGFSQYAKFDNLKERWRKYKLNKTTLFDVLKGLIRVFYPTELSRLVGNEMGYIYFQEFIPNNQFDIRVIVIGSKAFAIKRMVRKNDFRASGSGDIIYEKNEIDERCVSIAFFASKIIGGECLAYDFVFDHTKAPLIVEISYGFVHGAYKNCPGYWDEKMNWHPGEIDPCGWMVETVL